MPDKIPLGEHLYLEGGLHSSPYVKPADFLQLDLDLSLQDDRYPLEDVNLANFSEAASLGAYQLQLYISEYFLQSVITSLYWDNYFVLSPITLDDTVMTGLRDLIYLSGTV